MNISEARRLKELKLENATLAKRLAEQLMLNECLKGIASNMATPSAQEAALQVLQIKGGSASPTLCARRQPPRGATSLALRVSLGRLRLHRRQAGLRFVAAGGNR